MMLKLFQTECMCGKIFQTGVSSPQFDAWDVPPDCCGKWVSYVQFTVDEEQAQALHGMLTSFLAKKRGTRGERDSRGR